MGRAERGDERGGEGVVGRGGGWGMRSSLLQGELQGAYRWGWATGSYWALVIKIVADTMIPKHEIHRASMFFRW